MSTVVAPRQVKTRRISFEYPADQLPRHYTREGDLVMSHVVAVLSSLFPEGEDFFVRTVRNYRDEITDPELKRQVAGFIGQEAIHGREHRTLNDRLAQLGYPTRFIDRCTHHGLGLLEKVLPKRGQLAVTAALEHYTATLAEVLLTDPEARAAFDSDEVRSLLLWHALEENEHKSVAYDVYEHVSGNSFVRITVMRATTVGFLLACIAGTTLSLALDPAARRHPRRVWRSLKGLRTSPWLTRDVARQIRSYNAKGFHPDQHDTTELVERWRQELFGADGTLADRLAVTA